MMHRDLCLAEDHMGFVHCFQQPFNIEQMNNNVSGAVER